jgi:hypothetical protein
MSTAKLWDWLGDGWFYSRAAVSIFSISAALVLISLAFGFTLHLWPDGLRRPITNAFSNSSPVVQSAFALAGIVLGLAYVVIFVGMFRFWRVCDGSSRMARRIWFVMMVVGFVGLSLGTALYCFAVYLPQVFRNIKAR